MKPIELKLKTHSKILLTQVMLILTAVFAVAAVSPVYAAAPNPCLSGGFCDQDEDGFFRDHNKCGICLEDPGDPYDCDDSFYDTTNLCEGGSGGDYIQHFKSIRVIWGNTEAVESGLIHETTYHPIEDTQEMRLCGPQLDEEPEPVIPPHPMVDIKNVCHGNAEFLYGRKHWNTVYLDLSNSELTVGDYPGQLNASGRDSGLCYRLLEQFVADQSGLAIVPKKEKEPPEGPGCDPDKHLYCGVDPHNVGRLSSYFFVLDESNTEPCTWNSSLDNSCKVRIFTGGYFYNECIDPETETKCGRRIGMEAFGQALPVPKVDGEPTEINPFNQDQTIVIEELNVVFMGIGNNRTEANCYFNNETGEEASPYWYDSLVLRTCVDNNQNGTCDRDEPQ